MLAASHSLYQPQEKKKPNTLNSPEKTKSKKAAKALNHPVNAPSLIDHTTKIQHCPVVPLAVFVFVLSALGVQSNRRAALVVQPSRGGGGTLAACG
jgi:hypothetical protein